MKAYLALFRIRFINSLQYRAAALAGMATQFAWGFMEILAFSAFYRANPAAFPMEFSHTVSYIWMQQAFLALFMVWFYENEIFASITSGGIAYELARPADLYPRWFGQAAADRLAKAMLRFLPILMVALLLPQPFRLSPPPNAGQFALFLISAALSLGVVVALPCWSTYPPFIPSPPPASVISAVLADFLAGAIIPCPFPRALQEHRRTAALCCHETCPCASTAAISLAAPPDGASACRCSGWWP